MTNYRKKLIEVNIPLQAINVESAKDASLTHGHPSTLHRYWARRPLAACRAIIFASMVDDPSGCKDEFPTEPEQNAERTRLHNIIKRLVVWQNSNDENLLAEARYEIAYSAARNNGENLNVFHGKFKNDPEAVLHYLRDHCPPVYDPFCGGGSIPLEAQRLGLRARASDLNPLPVLLNKAMIELPPKFHNQKPVNPDADPIGMFTGTGRGKQRVPWKGTAGLAADIRYYGVWMREEAHKRIGHLYPKAQLPDGTSATVVAWLWARTIPCANPACGLQMPLMKTFQLSKERNQHWIRPIVDRQSSTISWIVQTNNSGVPNPTVNRTGAYCFECGTAINLDYVREQARTGRMGEVMTAIVAEGDSRKLFLPPTEEHLQVAMSAEPDRRPRGKLPEEAMNLRVQGYGVTDWHQLFTQRQLTALNAFSDLLSDVHDRMHEDGATERYTNAVCTYLTLVLGRMVETNCSFAWWQDPRVRTVFARQAIQMTWAFAEANPFSNSTQNWKSQIDLIAEVIENLPISANCGEVYQVDATTTTHAADSPIIITDPPYYDNIGYADLSDFFYIWLRPLLRGVYPELFGGMLTPKDEEMISNNNRFEDSDARFETLMQKALLRMCKGCSDEFPTSIFYAYKQQEKERDGVTSTGWETMLTAVVNAGFQIVGTWPMSTEQAKAQKTGKNALASSIVLVCRPRPEDAPVILRGDFLQELKKAMPLALERLTRVANIRPVDLAQAAIGPGMEVYSRYSKVTRISGEIVPIREVLMHINNEITAYHEKETGELDPESQFCLTWLKQHGYTEGSFGDAQILATAQDVDIATMHEKILIAARGKVRLLRGEEYAERENSENMTAWEGCLRMIWHLSGVERSGGISACTVVARAMRDYESAKRLARVLYTYYESRGDAESAAHYNNLVTQWQYISQSMRAPEQITADI
jgi:putative DNA methylase